MTQTPRSHGSAETPLPALGQWRADLERFSSSQATGLDEAELVDRLRALEDVKNAAAAAQAAAAARLDAATRSRETAAGVRAFRRGRGVASEVGLARRISPHLSRSLVGMAKLLPSELPCTWRVFRAGRVTEAAVLVIAKETACLEVEHRLLVDRAIAGDADQLERKSLKEIQAEALRLAAKLDPGSVVRRRRVAEGERRVTITPAPDTMSRVSITVPVEQGVAAYAALRKTADAMRGTEEGGGRSRGQLMADTAVERLTGQKQADQVPVRINLLMSDRGLLGGDDAGAAFLVERGLGRLQMPAAVARALVRKSLKGSATGGPASWLRRIYTHPGSGNLMAMDSTSRQVPAGLGDFITVRDGICRSLWCDAPVRHIDHVEPVHDGGATNVDNLQGLCEACNHAKQAPGWRQTVRAGPEGDHEVETTTPSGHVYVSRPPVSSSGGAA